MPGQNIGLNMPNGYAGSYARQPDMIIDSHPLGGDVGIPFGAALGYGTGANAGKVIPLGAGAAAADFVGVAARSLKSAIDYLNQNEGGYVPDNAIPVFKRGCINVLCAVGTPVLGGKVYLRVKANASIPTGTVGGFEAQADGENTVELPNCRWHGGADAEQVAELRILTLQNA